MKYLAPFLALFVMVLASCDTRDTPTSPSGPLSKVDRTTQEFTFSLWSDCCGGEYIPVTMKFSILENNNGLHYNWKANEWVTGASGSTYHVVYTDNGFTRWNKDDAMVGRVGTLHMTITRDDGCTVTVDIKLLYKVDANGNVVVDTWEYTTTCG